jgi:hypothetical protein
MFWKTCTRVNRIVKHNDGIYLKIGDLTYVQSKDILEAYSYTKKGSNRAIRNLLDHLRSLSRGHEELVNIDAALLLANTVTELQAKANAGDGDYAAIE